jgi:hypothetical protein
MLLCHEVAATASNPGEKPTEKQKGQLDERLIKSIQVSEKPEGRCSVIVAKEQFGNS